MKEKILKFLPWFVLILLIVAVSLYFFLGKRVTEGERSLYDEKIKQAELNFNGREYSEAINQYYEASSLIPQEFTAYKGIVDILLLKNRADEALSIVRESTRAISSNERSVLYDLIGDYYYDLADFKKAKEMYQEGLGLGVENLEAEFALGKALINIDRIDEGLKQIEKNEYEGDIAVEANLLLSYLYALTDTEKAKTQIGSITPSGKWTPFYDEFDNLLNSLDDDKKYNAVKLSRVYLNGGYPFLSLNILKTVEMDIAQYLEGEYFMGISYQRVGQYDKAIEYFDKALSLGGMETEILWGKARASYLKNDLEGAINMYSRAVEYGGKEISENLIDEYLSLLLENNQNLKAADTIKSLTTNQEKPYIYLWGVKVNYMLGERAKVDYYIEQLGKLELSENQQKEYLYWRARLAVEDSDTTGASVLLDQLLAKDRYNPKYYLVQGMLKVKESDIEGAKSSFERGIEYDLSNVISQEASKLLSNLK